MLLRIILKACGKAAVYYRCQASQWSDRNISQNGPIRSSWIARVPAVGGEVDRATNGSEKGIARQRLTRPFAGLRESSGLKRFLLPQKSFHGLQQRVDGLGLNRVRRRPSKPLTSLVLAAFDRPRTVDPAEENRQPLFKRIVRCVVVADAIGRPIAERWIKLDQSGVEACLFMGFP